MLGKTDMAKREDNICLGVSLTEQQGPHTITYQPTSLIHENRASRPMSSVKKLQAPEASPQHKLQRQKDRKEEK